MRNQEALNTLKDCLEWMRRSTQAADSFLDFAKKSNLCKVVSNPVPAGILPDSVFTDVMLHDIKVDPSGLRIEGKKKNARSRGSPMTDDEIYKTYKEIREMIARGNTVLTATIKRDPSRADSKPEHVACVPIWALRKFTGGIGDEDDEEEVDTGGAAATATEATGEEEEQADGGDADSFKEGDLTTETTTSPTTTRPIWHRFFTQDPNNTTQVVVTQKANGAAGHLAAIKIGTYGSPDSSETATSEYVWIGGSKNVHLMIRDVEDLKHYTTENRYSVASKVVAAAWNFAMKPGGCGAALNNLLWHGHGLIDTSSPTTTTNSNSNTVACLTACFELLDPEDAHVEDLSHMSSPELHLYAITSFQQAVSSNYSTYICHNPLVTLPALQNLGITTVPYSSLHLGLPGSRPSVESDAVLDRLCKEIRASHGSEGKVLYFINEEGDVIGMLKKKSVWYIVLRAIREKLKAWERVDRNPTAAPAGDESAVNSGGSKQKKKKKQVPGDFSPLAVAGRVGTKLRKRMRELASWLEWDDATHEFWTLRAEGINSWVERKITESDTGLELAELGLHFSDGHFPEMWNLYLRETGLVDQR